MVSCEKVGMQIVVVEPEKAARRMKLEHSLEAMQKLVGGPIQAIYPFSEPIALICNEEGKLLRLPFNRTLRDEAGEIYDIICGTFFLCAAPPDSACFAGLTEEQVEQYVERFYKPELAFPVGGALLVVTTEPVE